MNPDYCPGRAAVRKDFAGHNKTYRQGGTDEKKDHCIPVCIHDDRIVV